MKGLGLHDLAWAWILNIISLQHLTYLPSWIIENHFAVIKSRVQPQYFSKDGNHLNTSYLRVQTSYLFSNKTVRLSSLSSAVFTVKLSFIQSGNNFNEVVAKIPEVAVGMFTIISYKFTSSKDLLTLLAWEARSPLPSRNTSDFENLRLEFEDPIPQGHNNFKTRQDLRRVSIKHYLILYHTGTFRFQLLLWKSANILTIQVDPSKEQLLWIFKSLWHETLTWYPIVPDYFTKLTDKKTTPYTAVPGLSNCVVQDGGSGRKWQQIFLLVVYLFDIKCCDI